MTEREAMLMAIQGLLRIRDFLGLQLDHEAGNVSTADFEARARPYLAACEQDLTPELERVAAILACTTPMDAETIADALGLKHDDVRRATAYAALLPPCGGGPTLFDEFFDMPIEGP